MHRNETYFLLAPFLALLLLGAAFLVSDPEEKPAATPELPSDDVTVAQPHQLSDFPGPVPEGREVQTSRAESMAKRFYHPPRPAAPIPSELPAPAETLTKEAPRSCDWIHYLGLVEEKGTTRFFFKDLRNNRVMALGVGQRREEWLLENKGEGEFILEVEGTEYRISSSQR